MGKYLLEIARFELKILDLEVFFLKITHFVDNFMMKKYLHYV